MKLTAEEPTSIQWVKASSEIFGAVEDRTYG